MFIKQLKAKIHRATLTGADMEYEGSIAVDSTLLRMAGLEEFEAVHVWNVSTGARLETYVIEAPAGSGQICLNGAAARGASKGDVVIIAAWCWRDASEKFAPSIVLVDKTNKGRLKE